MWSFNFFFYNRKQKRILYFACRGKTHAAASSSGEESSECAYNSDAEVSPFCSAKVPRYLLQPRLLLKKMLSVQRRPQGPVARYGLNMLRGGPVQSGAGMSIRVSRIRYK